MKARELIQGATYGPETLKVIGKAFDDAWSEIGPHFSRTDCNPNSRDYSLPGRCCLLLGRIAVIPMN